MVTHGHTWSHMVTHGHTVTQPHSHTATHGHTWPHMATQPHSPTAPQSHSHSASTVATVTQHSASTFCHSHCTFAWCSMTPKVGTSGGGGQTPLAAGKCSGLSGCTQHGPAGTLAIHTALCQHSPAVPYSPTVSHSHTVTQSHIPTVPQPTRITSRWLGGVPLSHPCV